MCPQAYIDPATMRRERGFSIGCAVILPVIVAVFLLGMCSRMAG